LRARCVQPDPAGLARSYRRLFPSVSPARTPPIDPHHEDDTMTVRLPRRGGTPLWAFSAATLAAAWLSAASSGVGASQPVQAGRIRGFTAAASEAEAAREREMKAAPSAKAAEADFDVMTAEPHHTGSPYEIKLEDYVSDEFKKIGIEATKYEYSVLLPWPGRRRIELVAPDALKLEVEEEKIRGDQWADKPGILP